METEIIYLIAIKTEHVLNGTFCINFIQFLYLVYMSTVSPQKNKIINFDDGLIFPCGVFIGLILPSQRL